MTIHAEGIATAFQKSAKIASVIDFAESWLTITPSAHSLRQSHGLSGLRSRRSAFALAVRMPNSAVLRISVETPRKTRPMARGTIDSTLAPPRNSVRMPRDTARRPPAKNGNMNATRQPVATRWSGLGEFAFDGMVFRIAE